MVHETCDPLAGYKICNIIGEGAYGIVYKAVHIKTFQKVALKIMLPKDTESSFKPFALREIVNVQNLKSRFILTALDIFVVGRSLVLVYPLAQGDLHDLIYKQHKLFKIKDQLFCPPSATPNSSSSVLRKQGAPNCQPLNAPHSHQTRESSMTQRHAIHSDNRVSKKALLDKKVSLPVLPFNKLDLGSAEPSELPLITKLNRFKRESIAAGPPAKKKDSLLELMSSSFQCSSSPEASKEGEDEVFLLGQNRAQGEKVGSAQEKGVGRRERASRAPGSLEEKWQLNEELNSVLKKKNMGLAKKSAGENRSANYHGLLSEELESVSDFEAFVEIKGIGKAGGVYRNYPEVEEFAGIEEQSKGASLKKAKETGGSTESPKAEGRKSGNEGRAEVDEDGVSEPEGDCCYYIERPLKASVLVELLRLDTGNAEEGIEESEGSSVFDQGAPSFSRGASVGRKTAKGDKEDPAGKPPRPQRQLALNLPQIKEISFQLLRGLESLHRNNLVHRDLKPANILIDLKFPSESTEGGRCALSDSITTGSFSALSAQVKICDLGMSQNIGLLPAEAKLAVCTLWYRPPEAFTENEILSPAFDIWSAGCIIAEMVCGRPLLEGQDAKEQLALIHTLLGKRVELRPDKLNKLRMKHKRISAILGEEGLELLDKMIVLEPYKRSSAKELLEMKFFDCLKKR